MSFFFFFNDTATTEIYTLSLHDALPICAHGRFDIRQRHLHRFRQMALANVDRKSTRLNSSHQIISYAVFCLKKKKLSGMKTYQIARIALLTSNMPRTTDARLVRRSSELH